MDTVTKVTVEHLDPDHRTAFCQAIQTILADSLTELTMAQLIDGLPLADVAFESRGHFLCTTHPLAAHEQLCDGALEATRVMREPFSPERLLFNPHLVKAFSLTTLATAEFEMRLLEMVAVSIHQIAVALFNHTPKYHEPDYVDFVTTWQRPTGWVKSYGLRRWEEPLFPPRPTHFFHCNYLDFDLYPDGLADVAGYWAEDRILGGVAVFDRGQTGTECNDVFFDSGRSLETFRIWRLLDSQRQMLVDYLLGKPGEFSLPLRSTDQNVLRFDPWDAIALHHIFRDPWERRISPAKPPEGDVRSVSDYPELAATFAAVQEAAETRSRVAVEDPRPNNPHPLDRIWILKHGGVLGEPLGSRRLPIIGPPKEDSPTVSSDDEHSDTDSVNSLDILQAEGGPSGILNNLLPNHVPLAPEVDSDEIGKVEIEHTTSEKTSLG